MVTAPTTECFPLQDAQTQEADDIKIKQ